MVSNWEPAHSLVEDAGLRPRLPLAFWLWLWHTCLSASSWVEGSVHTWIALLWYSLIPLFCERARLCVRLEPFMGKFFYFPLSLAIPQFGLLSHIRSLRLSSGHSDLSFTLSMQSVPPYPVPAHWWQTPVSGLVLHWELQLGTCSVCVCFPFSLLVMLPSEIPKLPTDPLVRGFPAVWKLLLHNSLPRTGLCP